MVSESLDMKFEIGDKVVHPQHGVGYIANIEEKQFEPKTVRLYYVITIPDTTLWVPVDMNDSGLRKLSGKSDIDQCREVLRSAPRPLTSDRGLLNGLTNRMKEGTVFAHCEVIRDLSAFGWRKPLYGPVAEFKDIGCPLPGMGCC